MKYTLSLKQNILVHHDPLFINMNIWQTIMLNIYALIIYLSSNKQDDSCVGLYLIMNLMNFRHAESLGLLSEDRAFV